MKMPHVLLVSENVSMRMGGEASLAFYYLKMFLQRGLQVTVVCHERVQTELAERFAAEKENIFYVSDTGLQARLSELTKHVPYRIGDLIFNQIIHVITQARARALVRRLLQQRSIDFVFEPSPITPKGLSFMYNLGVPVAIGPLCGGMNLPKNFRSMDSALTRLATRLSRVLAEVANRVVPGKLNADIVFVANSRTERALPRGCRGEIVHVFESGVDLGIWHKKLCHDMSAENPSRPTFMFSGRFVDWKGVKYLVQAFSRVAKELPDARLELIGGGELENDIRDAIRSSKLEDNIKLHGWVDREVAAELLSRCDVFVMPSLRECGGTAILEAMALGKPVIAARWGGPADYITPGTGILVDPKSPEHYVQALAEAMIELGSNPAKIESMGKAAQGRVREDQLSWDSKVDFIIEKLLPLCLRTSSN